MGYIFTKKSIEDIESIIIYTIETWGLAQAEKYLHKLYGCFDKINQNRFIGEQINYVLPGFRKLSIGNHQIFYTTQDNRVYIVRVLHSSMDVDILEL